MNRSLLALLAALMSCTPPPPAVPGERVPGWYSLPDEQANRSWGTLIFRWTSPTRLEGQVSLPGEAPGQKLYLAVRWANTLVPVVLTQPFDSEFSVEVDPPAEAREPSFSRVCSGERASGLLLAYLAQSDVADPSRDELVSVSVKPEGVFSSAQAIGRPFVWDSCAQARPSMPLLLQHDPRLRLALCAPACEEPLFDRTHVVSAEVELDGERATLSFEVLGQWPELTVEVNGVVIDPSARERGPWREGANTVRVTAGALTPWTAEVVLPAASLGLELEEDRLRVGAPFTLSWQAPWAASTWVNAWPLDVPLLKVGDPWFTANGESVSDVFPGFLDGRGCLRAVPRALLQVRARLMDGPFGLSVVDSLVVPVE